MANVSPDLAARLATEVYLVEDLETLEAVLSGPEFSSSLHHRKMLSAEVGTRLIKTRDAFGACARGSGQYADDLFLIFRGTTTDNYGADIFTDLRTGLNVGATGSFVHAGFNHTFNSLRDDLTVFVSKQTGAKTIHCIGHSLGGGGHRDPSG